MSATPAQDAAQAADAGLELVLPGRSESAGAGATWIAEGWKLFARAPVMWIISIILLFIVAVAANLVPLIGPLAFQVLQAVIFAGYVVACRSLETGGEFELEHLWAGFTRRFGPLAIVGLLFVAGSIAILLVFAVFVGFGVLAAFMTGDPEAAWTSIAASFFSIAIGTLVMLALMVPLAAAFWFAPALVIMHDMRPVESMKQSFFACFRNFIPFIVYGVLMLIALVIAVIPLGLGLLVWVPLLIASTYAAYRRIFTEEAGGPGAPVVPAG